MLATIAVYAPQDSPTTQLLLRKKKRSGLRVMVIDVDAWRGEFENVKTVIVESLDSPIAAAHFAETERRIVEYRTRMSELSQKPDPKEEERLKYIVKAHRFKPAIKPDVVLDIDADQAAKADTKQRLSKGFPLSKADRERVRAAKAKRNTAKKL